ncbi:hypothetical protein [Actinomadura flavalba]|uniref:hypothetical protein n=1 Tax=Actinomadura flavalba TaxID=1120938 RepID=UPI0003767229|nr:hypothetical protein [Actinomadura flavalba]
MHNLTAGITPDPAPLSDDQRDGTSCVVCRTDYRTTNVPSAPIGKTSDGAQLFACTHSCAVLTEPPVCPGWCSRANHIAEDGRLLDHLAIVGRTRLVHGDGRRGVFGVRLVQGRAATKPGIGIHVYSSDREHEQPRMLWLNMRKAEVFAEIADAFGGVDLARLVRKALDRAAAEQEQEVGQ